MSASCDMIIKFHGSDEDFEKLIDRLHEIEGIKRGAITSLPYWPFTVNGHTITAYNGGCHNIWGSYYLDPEVDMYLELAKVVPDAAFDVSSSRIYEGGGGGCETYITVEYKDRKLTFSKQPFVDTVTLIDLCSGMGQSDSFDGDLIVAVSGKSKLFESQEELQDYLEEYGAEVKSTVNKNTTFVICNNKNSTSKKVTIAKELGVPVISEMEFVKRFGDVYDFEDDCEGGDKVAEIISSVTYEEFCQCYNVDDTVTRERFEDMIKNPDDDAFIISNEKDVSFDGPWETTQYILGNDGKFLQEVK